jgi:hypothetical protein
MATAAKAVSPRLLRGLQNPGNIMKTRIHAGTIMLALLAFTVCNIQLSTARAQGTAFTYQGKLNISGTPANGSYDLRFAVCDAVTNGNVTSVLTNTATGVSNGLFMVTLDFGNVFNGSNYWLEIAAQTNGGATFSTLSPRQPITPTPYAIYSANAGNALTAGSANSVSGANITGTIPLAKLPGIIITNNQSGVTLNNLSVTATNQIAPLTVPPKVPVAAVGSAGTGANPYCVAVAGRYAYVVNRNSSTLQVFDVSIPSTPVAIGSVGTGSLPISVAVAGRYAYVVNYGASTLQIFDVGNPSLPVNVGSVGTENSPVSVAVSGRYAYVANYGASTLQIFDVGNPASPVSVASVATGNVPFCVAVAGRYAYVANNSDNTLQIFDVGNPSSPVSVGLVNTGINPYSIAVAGRYAYVANIGDNTLQIFDVSTSSVPVGVGSVGTGASPYCVAVAGRYAYVVNGGSSTFQIFDVSNPSSPVNIGSVGTGTGPISVAISGRYAYAVNYTSSSLQVFDLGGAYIQQLETGTMETGTLQTRDTVTVGNNLNVRGSLTASGSARISGGLSVEGGTVSAPSFTGNGSGLTSLNATQLIGPIPLAQLPTNLLTNNATNLNLSGTFTGNGAGLTNLNVAQLPGAVLTNNQIGVTLVGTFSGNGSGLTNLISTNLTGTITDARLSTNVAWLNTPNPGQPAMGFALVSSGGISSAVVTFGGSGYLTPPAVAVSTANGSGGIITATISNGVVTALNVINPGSYSVNTSLTIAPPPASQTFNGAMTFANALTATNVNNLFNGAFVGNGTGLTNFNGYVAKSGDTMTGLLHLPTDGLSVGSSQLVLSNGNVGIGTTNPTYPLDTTGWIRSQGAGGYGLLMRNTTTAKTWQIGNNGTDLRISETGVGDNVTFQAGGNVGIGTTTPGATLDVNGTVKANNFSGNGSGLASLNANNLTGTLSLANGGTGAAGAASARGNLGAAASGANADITSLGALATPLSVSQGGTGAGAAPNALTNLGAASLTSQNTFSGVNVLTNLNNVFNGTFTGNGAGLTNLNAVVVIPSAINANSLTLGTTNVVAPLTVPPTVPSGTAGTFGTNSFPYSIALSGRYVYAVDLVASTLQIIDVSTPSAPASVGLLGTIVNPSSVAVAGSYAYVVNVGGTLQIIDISKPSSPVSLGSFNAGMNGPCSVAVSGRYAYMVNNYYPFYLQIVDVSIPTSPANASWANLYFGYNYNAVSVAGRYAYLANVNGLDIYDVGTPSSVPVRVGSCSASSLGGLVVSGRYVYGTGGGYLRVFDVSNPSAPIIAGLVSGAGSSIAVAGRYAYTMDNQLQIFDVSNPQAPIRLGSLNTGGNLHSIVVSGRYAYVVNVNGTNLLQIYDLGGAYIQQLEAGTIETGTLQTRDTVTVGNNLDVSGGLTVSGSARISGGLSVNSLMVAGGGYTGNVLVSGVTFYITNGIIMKVQ